MAEPEGKTEAEIREIFAGMDVNTDGKLTQQELGSLFEEVGEKLPGYRLREIMSEVDTDKNGSISFEEFLAVYNDMQRGKVSSMFKTLVTKREGIKSVTGSSEVSSTGTTHSYSEEEKVAFTDYINSQLREDKDLASKMDIQPDDLFKAVGDGILLCKMINLSSPGTIDERAITKTKLNVYTRSENLTLALNSAKAIGCSIVNIDPQDLQQGVPHLVLGVLWQIIRIGLFAKIDLHNVPGLIHLLHEGEELEDLQKLSPEELLIRWVNYHLEQSGSPRRIKDFSGDIKDSEVYDILLRQICPSEIALQRFDIKQQSNMERRAELVLGNADLLGCKAFVTPKDIVAGNSKLNMAFVANLFNHHPGLEPPGEIEYEEVEETREEKTFRNWMNSLNVKPHVNYLYSDLCNGLVLLQLIDICSPGMVNWDKVNQGEKLKKMGGNMKKVENCNYCIELGRQMKFSLVGIGGKDINDGNDKLTLALVWQLMRAYTLRMLQNISGSEKAVTDAEIVDWANQKLEQAGKDSRIKSFQDPVIGNGRVIMDLVDAISPGSINYDLYIDPNEGAEDDDQVYQNRLQNAQYTISIARKRGAMVYALPEDIVEVKPKMVMTIFACLMALALGTERENSK
ncbi:plastin-3-like [Diadema antillarum]|uniref:plastin-3-like n=1 Tax=Diadema antillarum TaxID=105358 RepID=UPI003A8BA35F